MKVALLLVVLCIVLPSVYGVGQYVKTNTHCNITEPANPGLGWIYCVEQSAWFNTDCSNSLSHITNYLTFSKTTSL